MTNILQVLLGLALVNYLMFDVVAATLKPTTKATQLKIALIVAATTAAVFLPAILLSSLFEQFVLNRETSSPLSMLVFIVALAAILHGIATLLAKRQLLFASTMNMFLLLIFTNCIVMGVTMPSGNDSTLLNDIVLAGLARCAGFAVVLAGFTALGERLRGADIPAAFRGAPATLLTAAVLSMTFMGLAGLA